MNVPYWIIAISWVLSIALTAVLIRRRTSSDKDSFMMKLFQSNQDLDTTLMIVFRCLVVFAILGIVVIFFSMFHDDLAENDVGMLGMHVIGMASQGISLVAIANGTNGKKKDDGDDT